MGAISTERKSMSALADTEAARFLAAGARAWRPAATAPAVSLVAGLAMMVFAAVSFEKPLEASPAPEAYAFAKDLPNPNRESRLAASPASTSASQIDASASAPVGGMIDQKPSVPAEDAGEMTEDAGTEVTLPTLGQVNPEAATDPEAVAIPDYDPDPKVMAAIVEGSAAVDGADPAYMAAVSSKESGFDPKAKARRSSARGLFQFTNVTWMRVVKQFGGRHGLAHMAEAVFQLEDGRMGVKDWDTRTKLLALREDPYLSTAMAGELAMDDKRRLESTLGREAGVVDMYFAHLLGVGKASDFLQALDERPEIVAAEVAPSAAKSNPAIFKDSKGRYRTVAEVHEVVGKDISARVRHYAEVIDLDWVKHPGADVAMLRR